MVANNGALNFVQFFSVPLCIIIIIYYWSGQQSLTSHMSRKSPWLPTALVLITKLTTTTMKYATGLNETDPGTEEQGSLTQ